MFNVFNLSSTLGGEFLNEEINITEQNRTWYFFYYSIILTFIFFLINIFLTFGYHNKNYLFDLNLLTICPLYVAIYNLLRIAFIKFYLKRHKVIPLSERIFNSFAEAVIPGLIIIYITSVKNIHLITGSGYLLLYVIFIIFSTLRIDFRLSLLTGLSCAISYFLVIYLMIFINIKNFKVLPNLEYSILLIRTLLLFLIGIAAAFVSIQITLKIRNSLNHLYKRKEIEALLGMHVSSEVARELINNKKTDNGIEQEISILFLDIREFTSFCENKNANEVFLYLNNIFEEFIRIVITNNGIINKFLGDGFMAVFGAPIATNDHATSAVYTALEIYNSTKEFNEKNKNLNFETKIRIGIHSGKALAGSIGSLLRKEYTIIGDVVNIASRLEQMNKALNSSILISENTLANCNILLKDISYKGNLTVRGRKSKIKVYKLV